MSIIWTMIHYCLHTTKKLIKWFKTQRSDNFHAYLPFSHTGSFHDLLYGPNIKFTITLLMWRKVEFRRCVLKFKERRFTGFLSVYDDCVKMFLCRYLHNYHWCWGKSHGVSISTSCWQWRGCSRRGHTSHFNVEEENIADYDFDA